MFEIPAERPPIRRVLAGVSLQETLSVRHDNPQNAACFQNSMCFAKKVRQILTKLNMLEHVLCQHTTDGSGRERQPPANIELEIRVAMAPDIRVDPTIEPLPATANVDEQSGFFTNSVLAKMESRID